MNNIGDILRQARIKEQLSFDDVVEKTGIAPHYLLAMELDQLKLLPEGKANDYLERYANAVGLDPISIIHGYRNQQVGDQSTIKSYKIPEKEALREDLSQLDFQESLTLEQTPIAVPLEEKQEELPEILIEEEDVSFKRFDQAEDFQEAEDFDLDDEDLQSEALPSRSARYDDDEEPARKRSFPWVLSLLAVLALGIIAYVGYTIYSQLQADPQPTEQTTITEGSNTEETTTTAPDNQAQLVTDFAQGGRTITLTNPSSQVDIVFTLVGDQGSWVSATGTTIGEAGTTLSSVETSYTVTLAEGATSSYITIGVSDMVGLSIDGQEVDLTDLAGLGVVNLNLVIE